MGTLDKNGEGGLPCGDSRYCPIGDIRSNIASIQNSLSHQHSQYKEDVSEIKQGLNETRELLSNFKALTEAMNTLKGEQFENRRTFAKLFDKLDDLQRTKADNTLRTEIMSLQNNKGEASEITACAKKVEENIREIAERPTRKEIFSMVSVVSVIIGILFSVGNFLINMHEKKEVRAAIHEALQGVKHDSKQP